MFLSSVLVHNARVRSRFKRLRSPDVAHNTRVCGISHRRFHELRRKSA
jgi:hypothetical protein